MTIMTAATLGGDAPEGPDGKRPPAGLGRYRRTHIHSLGRALTVDIAS